MPEKTEEIKVFSPLQLPDSLKSELTVKLHEKIGKYTIVFLVDDSLVLGLRVEFGDTEFNYNLTSETNHILTELLK